MMATIESYRGISTLRRGERLTVKGFKYRDDMFKFLAKGDNALRWRESNKGLKPGVYAYAGGRWLNVKHLDACALAHI